MNALRIIKPYRWNGMWVFDDESVGLQREPFVSGADTIIDHAVADIEDADEGFLLTFSDAPFPGHTHALERRRAEYGGNWYYAPEFDQEGWLCPALFEYFDTAPETLYAKVDPCPQPPGADEPKQP